MLIKKRDKKNTGNIQDIVRSKSFKSLKSISVQITKNTNVLLNLGGFSRCNLNCIFCSSTIFIKPEDLKRDDKKTILSLNDFKLYLSMARKNYPQAAQLCIGGNEPLDYPYILRLIRYAKKIGFKKIFIETTGILLASKSLADSIIKAGVSRFELPIYGASRELHDKITRTKGSFDSLMLAIENLRQNHSVEIVLHTVLLKQNYLSIFDLYDFAIGTLNFHRIDYRKVRPVNSNIADYDFVCPRYGDIKEILKNNKFMPKAKFDIPFCALPVSYLKVLFAFGQKKIEKSFLPAFRGAAIKISQKGINIDNHGGSYSSSSVVNRLSKSKKCGNCQLAEFCRGVPELYLDLYGDQELKPFKLFPSASKKFL